MFHNKYLEGICGLEVIERYHPTKNERIFEFFYAGQMIKSCFTYPKAKLFAEGIQFGFLKAVQVLILPEISE